MSHRSVLRVGVLTIVVSFICALTGCTTDGHNLPSISGNKQPEGSTLEIVAKKFYDCMSDGGIKVKLTKNNQQELSIVEFTNYSIIMYSSEHGGGVMMGSESATYDEVAVNDFFMNSDDKPRLVIDGVDHSELYATCLEESDYDENAAWGEYYSNPADSALQVEANNKWASCAREHGFPSVKDTEMSTDGSITSVLLPATVTPEQLRTLLEECPNFDPEAQAKYDEWWAKNPMSSEYPPGYLPEPWIGFEQNPNATDEDWEKESQLYDVLYEKQNEYWDSQSDGDIGIAIPR